MTLLWNVFPLLQTNFARVLLKETYCSSFIFGSVFSYYVVFQGIIIRPNYCRMWWTFRTPFESSES